MSRRIVIVSRGPAETRAVGRAIGRAVGRGSVVSLEGPLGAGKTLLAAGVCEALGVEVPVTSPTFALEHEYRGGGGRRVIHVDCFRLTGPRELEELDTFDRVDEDTILLVEWGDRVISVLPEETLRVRLDPEGEDVRRIRIDVPGGVELRDFEPAGGP
ncbi:MAG: tRNA (adenosine(37)-N6)-threonylcarbamoyltransferase complex ATPase subunit type 1 TsaE [Candidatus Eiseniibacteriota bacterium]